MVGRDFRHSGPIFRDELRRAVRKGNAALLRTVSEGFAAIDPGGSGVGIAGMRERIEQLGGRFEITSGARGTTVRARLPA